jgi:hypothetical protein
MFRPSLAIFGRNIKYFKKLSLSQRIHTIQAEKSVVTFEDFMAVTINITESTVFKVLMLCALEKARHSAVIYYLRLLRSKSKPRKKAAEAGASFCVYFARFTL